MRDFLDQIDAATNANFYYVACACALAVPDICTGLEASDGRATGARYRTWFDQWVAPKYGFQGGTSLDGDACYRLRCSLLHEGSALPTGGSFSRVLFVEPDASGNVFHNNVLNDALNLDVRIFCRDVTDSARTWLTTAEGTEPFATNFERFIRRHPNGLAPYIVGVPVIGFTFAAGRKGVTGMIGWQSVRYEGPGPRPAR